MPVTQTTAVGPPQVGQTGFGKSVLGKDDFLKLLVQQLRYQDPMNPMKGAEFASQLAEFSSVEQLHNISNALVESINANFILTQAINNGLAAGFVGKDVRASGNTFNLSNDGNQQSRVRLGYSLASAASTVEIKIKNEQGEVVRTIRGAGSAKGDNTFEWDGRDDNGVMLPEGKYSFAVEAKDGNNNAVGSSPFVFGKVSAVRFTAEGTKFVINGQEIFLGDILEILNG